MTDRNSNGPNRCRFYQSSKTYLLRLPASLPAIFPLVFFSIPTDLSRRDDLFPRSVGDVLLLHELPIHLIDVS